MVIKLNWNLRKIPIVTKIEPNIILVLLFIFICTNTSAQEDAPDHTDSNSSLTVVDTIVAKTNKIIIEEDTLPAYSISVGKVGSIFPCGARFGISLQAPGYHIFSAESAFNATFTPNGEDILWPDEGSDKNNQIYQNTFNRVKKMRVGKVGGSFGERWTISAQQFKANYGNLFDFELDGQMKKAGDYSNMFFEMLISIQQLAKENDDLKAELNQMGDRLAALEAKINSGGNNFINGSVENEIKIYPNPTSGKTLNVEYSINTEVKKAILYIYDLNGKTLYKTLIDGRKTGNITQLVDLIPGVYFYQLSIDSNKGISHKLIIN